MLGHNGSAPNRLTRTWLLEVNEVAFRMRYLAGVFGALFLSALVAIAAPAQAQDGNAPLSELLVEGPLGDVWMGDENAPVTIIEYASMTCPHCANFHATVYEEFVAKYVDTGLVRFTIREFPIDPPGVPLSAAAFMLTRCAPGENGYFAMIDLLFEMQPLWAQVQDPITPLLQLSLQSGFTEEDFYSCLDNRGIQEAVYWVYDRGVELGVNATPTFFIDGDRYAGALSLQQLDDIIATKL